MRGSQLSMGENAANKHHRVDYRHQPWLQQCSNHGHPSHYEFVI